LVSNTCSSIGFQLTASRESHSEFVHQLLIKILKNCFVFFSAISDQERTEIRRGLLQCFNEPSYPVALQIAVVVGKAARSLF
jgi:hypothetical protein